DSVRHPAAHPVRRGDLARRLPGPGGPGGQCGFQVRTDPAVRGPRAAAEGVRRPGLHGPRRALQPVRGPGAGQREEIATFCSATYGVSFPMLEKTDVNGEGRHPLYAELTKVADAEGEAGDIQWNFEKFLISPRGEVTRFRPGTEPESPEVLAAVEAVLSA
ncbi:LOW QUALITY PROTEIN: glutathione peroxidase, partial [Streptomyces pristinaespiralis ATCC 25486]